MIVWSGRGALSVLVLVVSFVLFNSIIPKAYGDYAFVLGFFCAGAFSWFFGKKWNEEQSRTFVDKATGQEIAVSPNHSLFWIKMQYWGIIFGAFGLIVLVQALV
jgi:hypothetical protein